MEPEEENPRPITKYKVLSTPFGVAGKWQKKNEINK